MKNKYSLVTVKSRYCDFLRKYDNRVSYNSNNKEIRPFVGVLFEINNCRYFAPLSSPKPKHLKMKNTIDFYKIDSGKLGAINLNNMSPIPDTEFTFIDTTAPCLTNTELKYQTLLKNQIYWLNRDGISLSSRAEQLYNDRKNNKLKSHIADRCCDFILLEEKCIEYNRVQETLQNVQHIDNEEDLFYIYDNLDDKDKFENVIVYLDNIDLKANIQDMSKEEINDIVRKIIGINDNKNKDIYSINNDEENSDEIDICDVE